ncbi:MAG TPA: hypothetical protein VFE11_17810, partial [Dongiaceae bacterium]|nr:hypothetical protein [Dongiaceae bacterium]
MVGILKQPQCGAPAKPIDERLKLLQIGQRISGPLQEQHRDLHIEQVLAALTGRAPRGMEREG